MVVDECVDLLAGGLDEEDLPAVSEESRSIRATLCGSAVATVRVSPAAAIGITRDSRQRPIGEEREHLRR